MTSDEKLGKCPCCGGINVGVAWRGVARFSRDCRYEDAPGDWLRRWERKLSSIDVTEVAREEAGKLKVTLRFDAREVQKEMARQVIRSLADEVKDFLVQVEGTWGDEEVLAVWREEVKRFSEMIGG